MRTGSVKALVREVLTSMPQPRSEHVIDEVFFSIETTPVWQREYESLCATLGKTVVNTWSGYWIGNILGKVGERQVASKKSKLIESYSLLDTDAKTVIKKPKEAEVLRLMSGYYQAHKSELPSDIRKYRQEIIELLMEGMSPIEAFSAVQKERR
jgi:hypothetical protein